MMNVNSDNKTWPMLLDMTKDECKKTLRSLELSAYGNIISVFRAQGELTKEKRKLLSDLQSIFAISVERHRAEIRRAVNDERLNTIAETLAGPNTNIEWTIEGRRLIPLMPRAPPQVAYTALATRMAQLYCGINSQLPNPCDTALYGKLDDLGADKEATDSEDETEGLRYITDSMIPQQYNADQGAYTTLPISEARLTKEKLKEKKENIEDLNHEVPPSSPLNPCSVSSGSNASPCSQPKPHVVVGSEKRKRKRSSSTDHPPPHSPPPPPAPTLSQAPSSSNGVQSGGQTQSASTAIRQLPNIGPSLGGSSMKITVTGGMTRSSSATSTNSSAQQQKVILVSTSAASGTVGNIYQRSISVPILKSAPQTSLTSLSGIPPILGVQASSQSGILKSTVSTPSASVVGSSVMTKIRPRFSSSILSQGSSSLPGLPPRPPLRSRSNSLILQTEGESSGLTRSSSGPSFSQASSAISECSGPNSSSLNFIGATSLQLRPGSSLAPKSNLQVKQEGGKLIAHSMVSGASLGGSSISSSTLNAAGSGTGNVVGSRIIGRGSIPPSSSQGLYMVSTTSGTITVVTRTVASASISTPRVMTVNTINSSRPSIVRGPSSSSVMSVGMNPKAVSTMRQTGSIRPVISGPKSNVIVVHKGTIGPGSRPVGLHGLRDLSTKIIKPSQQGLSGNISSNSGILSGTLVVKPSVSTKSLSSTKEPCTVIGTSVSSSSGTTTTVSSSGNNLIVVDLNCESASGAQSSTSAVSNILPTPGTSSTVTRNVNSLFACTSRNLSEATSTLQKRESSSHDISTVSASSSLPSTFRVIKTPSLPSDSEDTGFDLVESDLQQRTEDRMPISNQVTSSSDIKDSIDVPDESEPMMGTKETAAASSLSIEDHEDEEEEEEEEEDNEWLKLGLEDEEDPEMEDEDDRGSEVDCEIEKLATSAEESMENEADMVGDSPKAIDSASDEVTEGGKPSKAGTSGEASVSSSTGTGNEKEGDLQMLVEKAVEVLQDGDSDQARSLLYNAGFELIDSSSDPDQGPSDGFSISNIAGVSSSSAVMGSGTPLSSSTPLRDESSLGSMSELDPATGYFYSPSAGENSSEPTSNKADSPTPRENDSVPEENQD